MPGKYGKNRDMHYGTILLEENVGNVILIKMVNEEIQNQFTVMLIADSVLSVYGANYLISRTTHQPSDHVMVSIISSRLNANHMWIYLWMLRYPNKRSHSSLLKNVMPRISSPSVVKISKSSAILHMLEIITFFQFTN